MARPARTQPAERFARNARRKGVVVGEDSEAESLRFGPNGMEPLFELRIAIGAERRHVLLAVAVVASHVLHELPHRTERRGVVHDLVERFRVPFLLRHVWHLGRRGRGNAPGGGE